MARVMKRIPMIGVASDEYHRSYFYSPKAFANAFQVHGKLFRSVEFRPSLEIGQILALSAVFIVLSVWRSSSSYLKHAFVTNTALMTGGFLLAGVQMSAFFLQPPY